MLLYDQDIIGAFSEIFGNLRKLSEKCSESFASRVQLDISVEHSKIKFISTLAVM